MDTRNNFEKALDEHLSLRSSPVAIKLLKLGEKYHPVWADRSETSANRSDHVKDGTSPDTADFR